MLQGPLNSSSNQRTIAIAIAFFIGLMLVSGAVNWNHPLLGPFTIGTITALGSFYIAIALYKNWF